MENFDVSQYQWQIFQHKNQVNGESFAYLWVILQYFNLESRLIPAMLESGPSQVVLKID